MGGIISGLLIGILFSRTIAGWLGGEFGWASVYAFTAVLNGALSIALYAAVPETSVDYHGTYGDLMKSLLDLVKKYATLRESMLFGALFFGAFSCFWATLDFLLLQPPFRYGSKTAGLFGLIGAAGASVAPVAGKLSDEGDPRKTIGIGIALALVAFAAMWAGQDLLWVIVIGTALMDMGVQAGHVTNQTRIYSLDPSSRSRFATIYVFSYFVGGAIGSSAGSWSFARWNWAGPSVVSISAFAAAGGIYVFGARRQ
jgi:predicted MFS family arabinose efflux permease